MGGAIHNLYYYQKAGHKKYRSACLTTPSFLYSWPTRQMQSMRTKRFTSAVLGWQDGVQDLPGASLEYQPSAIMRPGLGDETEQVGPQVYCSIIILIFFLGGGGIHEYLW